MNRRLFRSLLAATLAFATASCAARGYVPEPNTMPAARAALRPELRIFYDALVDYGDWALIEPFGFVFRPRVDFATFRPYQDGFWAPSDPWGWVWISAEPFGWATYHYGNWIWDRFQGWVWIPGVDWGPAWVSWQIAGPYAGWAPLGPGGAGGLAGPIPGGAYLYAPIDRMGSTDLSAHVATQAKLGAAVAGAEPVENLAERDGVRFNLGPSFGRIERAQGRPLSRVKIEDLAEAPGRRGQAPAEAPAAPGIEATRSAGASAARQARALIERGGASPSNLALPRPASLRPADADPPPAKPARRPGRGAAAADTTR